DDYDRSEKIDNRSDEQLFSLVHRERQRLEHEIIVVAVENHTRQAVAFAPNDPSQFWIDLPPVAILICLCDSPFKKIEIEVLPLPREAPRDDLRFGIVDRASD